MQKTFYIDKVIYFIRINWFVKNMFSQSLNHLECSIKNVWFHIRLKVILFFLIGLKFKTERDFFSYKSRFVDFYDESLQVLLWLNFL